MSININLEREAFLSYIQEHLIKVTKNTDEPYMSNDSLFEWLKEEDIEALAGTCARVPFEGMLDNGETVKVYRDVSGEPAHLADVKLIVEIGEDVFMTDGVFDAISNEYEFYADFTPARIVEKIITKTVVTYEEK